MSVLIKGVEMPKKDHVRVLVLRDDGRCIDEFGDVFPVTVVPPHGRLIDADEYEKILYRLGNRDYRREKGSIQDAIKFLHPHYAPTIIPASEGRQGHDTI